ISEIEWYTTTEALFDNSSSTLNSFLSSMKSTFDAGLMIPICLLLLDFLKSEEIYFSLTQPKKTSEIILLN
ncbi:MAG: hypothetical protein ACK4IX_09845, partial [Candidatus Sericytochromatia bacterium]